MVFSLFDELLLSLVNIIVLINILLLNDQHEGKVKWSHIPVWFSPVVIKHLNLFHGEGKA